MRKSTEALNAFFARCREVKWFVRSDGAIRVKQTIEMCPLRYVSGSWSPREAAMKLGISTNTAWRIANGADHRFSRNRQWLKQKLGMRV